MKKRADQLLFDKGLVESREKGKRVIMEGSVYVGTVRIDKPGEKIEESSDIKILKNPLIYVSRGGLKLEKAMEDFNITLTNTVAMDIGASTGGFTDCMLRSGSRKVFAVDVGYGQLDWKLRNDPRVVVMERTNIRHVTEEDIGERLDFISIDVSFISLQLVLPVAKSLLAPNGEIVALVKPQFEAGKGKVGKNGIVRDRNIHFEVLNRIVEFSRSIDLVPTNLGYSPITGAKGNIEFLIHLKNSGEDIISVEKINSILDQAYEDLK
ncbi:MAG: TlyA family RNA methyltransferase [Tissierellia bacterium]|nr:TlyA family RNA methyltransferase [Tissierellia bacterium]